MKSLLPSLVAACALIAVPSLSAAEAQSEVKVGEFTLKATEGWSVKESPRPMSKGGFTYKSKDGKTLEADTYYFGEGQGGDVEANVARWKGQFQAPDGGEINMERKELEFGSQKATMLHLKGTFLSGGPFQPKKTPMPGYAMLGAVLESESGNVFVKLTGPEKEVEAAREAFLALIKSAYPAAAPKAAAPDKKAPNENPDKK